MTPADLGEAKEPQVAIGRDGRCYVAYGSDGNILVSVSGDGGATFGAPILVAHPKTFPCGMRRGPRIAVSGDAVVVSAVVAQRGGGREGDLVSWTSRDRGRTWSRAARVSDVNAAAREGLHGMAADDKVVAAVWLDLRQKGTTIQSSVSLDGGQSWSANRLVYRSPSGSVCECCHPSVTFGPKGEMAFMWRNSLEGNRDLYFSVSRDQGKSFSAAAKLGNGSWPLNACPMDGGALAFLSNGTIQTFWRREGALFACQPGKAEEKIGDGEQGWVAASGMTPVYVWLEHRGAGLWCRTGAEQPVKLSGAAVDPVVASSGGSKPFVLAAWTEGGVVFARRILNSSA